jgi:hypothetical protein
LTRVNPSARRSANNQAGGEAKEVTMKRAVHQHHAHRTRRFHVQASHPRSVPILQAETPQSEQPFVDGTLDPLDPDLRHRLVSETAYRHLAERGYAEGYERDDWLEAETEVDHTVVKPATPRE